MSIKALVFILSAKDGRELEALRKKAYTWQYNTYDAEGKKEYRERHKEKFKAYWKLYDKLYYPHRKRKEAHLEAKKKRDEAWINEHLTAPDCDEL
jgi:hypothetical protein